MHFWNPVYVAQNKGKDLYVDLPAGWLREDGLEFRCARCLITLEGKDSTDYVKEHLEREHGYQ